MKESIALILLNAIPGQDQNTLPVASIFFIINMVDFYSEIPAMLFTFT